MPAEVGERNGAPTLTVEANAVAFGDSIGTLTEVDGRWRVDGGMFDGWELDFDGTDGDRRFCGGVYPFEFVADETPVAAALPSEVDVHGRIGGAWAGSLDTPLGTIPIELTVEPADGTVVVDVMGTNARDDHADVGGGWIHARVEVDAAGFGAVTLLVRLGSTDGGLRGLLWARNASIGEIRMLAALDPSS